jgi:hypothetical protein
MSETVLAGGDAARNSRPVTKPLPLRVVCALCAVLLAACIGGQTGQENRAEQGVDCAFERTALQLDETTSLGFTAAELEAELASDITSSMHWSRMGTTTTLTLTLREVRARALSISTNGACPDTIELQARVAVSTADGLLDEEIDATISAESAATWSLNGEVALDAIAGELDAAELDLDLSTWREPRLALRLWGSAIHGFITLGGEDPNPSDNEFPVAASIADLTGP